MINSQKVLAVIVARGGSKGLPGKNIMPVGGKPMVVWSLDAARGSRYLDRTILSSDDPAIIDTVRAAGGDVPFVRPSDLSNDTTAIGPVIAHALDAVSEHYDWVVLLQATSPLRQSQDIDACLELAIDRQAPAVISVTTPSKSPYWMCHVDQSLRMTPLLEVPEGGADRRQALPPVYVPNGAVYVARTDWFRQTNRFTSAETLAYIMPSDRSVDVDFQLDLVLADALLTSKSTD